MWCRFLLLTIVLYGANVAGAQSTPAPTPAGDLLRSWNFISQKIIEMAEDFPEDKYDYKPTPEVRSFAEILLHVAGGNEFFLALAQGKPANEADPPREKYKTRAEVVAFLKKTFGDGAAYIEQNGEELARKTAQYPWSPRPVTQYGLWADAVEHAGEHYGNLVVYYRVNGLVPPASRPRR